MNLALTCGCGERASMPYSVLRREHPWRCAGCGQEWQAEQQSLSRFADLAAALRRTRVTVLLALAIAVGAAAVLASVHPSWAMLVPLVLGVAAFFYRPRYKRRIADLCQDIPHASLRKVHSA